MDTTKMTPRQRLVKCIHPCFVSTSRGHGSNVVVNQALHGPA
jgi:hypothetical protein